MKWITLLCDVKDGPGYIEGERRCVSDDTAAYFASHGWAKSEDGAAVEPDLSPKTLDVQNGKHGHAAREG
jgi:hypothetical protein